MNDETIFQFAKQCALSNIQLRAKCDALEAVVLLLSVKVGWDKDEVSKQIQAFEDAALLERQIRVEDYLGPEFAADTFDQPPPPE